MADQPDTFRQWLRDWGTPAVVVAVGAFLWVHLDGIESDLKSDIGQVRSDVRDIRHDIAAIRTDLKETTAALNARIDDSNKRIDASNRRIDDSNRRIDLANRRMDEAQGLATAGGPSNSSGPNSGTDD